QAPRLPGGRRRGNVVHRPRPPPSHRGPQAAQALRRRGDYQGPRGLVRDRRLLGGRVLAVGRPPSEPDRVPAENLRRQIATPGRFTGRTLIIPGRAAGPARRRGTSCTPSSECRRGKTPAGSCRPAGAWPGRTPPTVTRRR